MTGYHFSSEIVSVGHYIEMRGSIRTRVTVVEAINFKPLLSKINDVEDNTKASESPLDYDK